MSLSVASQAKVGGCVIVANPRQAELRAFAAIVARWGGRLPAETFDNGLDCLQCLGPGEGALAAPMPWLCILDYHLPGVDGMYLLGRIRADPLLHRLPVVLTGREADGGIVRAAYAAGANSCVLMPEDEGARHQVWERLLDYWLRTAINPVGRRLLA